MDLSAVLWAFVCERKLPQETIMEENLPLPVASLPPSLQGQTLTILTTHGRGPPSCLLLLMCTMKLTVALRVSETLRL